MPKRQDPAEVGEPGAHPPKRDLPDNDPADAPRRGTPPSEPADTTTPPEA